MNKSRLDKAKTVLRWIKNKREIRYPSKFHEDMAFNTYLLFCLEGKGKYRAYTEKELVYLGEIYDYHLTSYVPPPPKKVKAKLGYMAERRRIRESFSRAVKRHKK